MDEKQLDGLREALKASPDNVPLRRMLAEGLLALGQLDAAESEATKALQRDGDDTGSKIVLARSYLYKGKQSMGLVLIEDVLRARHDDATVWLLHAKLLFRAGQREEAQRSLQQAATFDPSLRGANLNEIDSGIGNVPSTQDDTSATRRRALAAGGGAEALIERTFPSDALEPSGGDEDGESERSPIVPDFVLERPAMGFDDVGGMSRVKEQVQMKVILPATNQELYAMYGKKAGGGILLYGPPGCGKTHIARATAGEIDAAFITVGLHDILDMWIGNSEKRLHTIFEYARAHAPCVLFFDEADALAASRTDMRTSGGRHLINQFLSELDGVDVSNDGVLILAATNAPWHLDPAFRRPGRFDEMIFVPPPDAEARACILELLLKGKPVGKLDYGKVAAKADKFSGADLRGLVDHVIEEKLKQAMKTGKPEPIDTGDLVAGLKRRRASTHEWLATARNYAAFANEGGVYDEIKAYLNLK